MSDEKDPRPEKREEEPRPPAPPEPEAEDYDDEDDEGLDPRVLALVGIIVLLIVVIYWRRAAGPDEDDLPAHREPPAVHEEEHPERRPPTYEDLVMQRRAEASQYIYHRDGETLVVARPPIPPRPTGENDEMLPAEPGVFFNVTQLAEEAEPDRLYRRQLGNQHAFMDMLPPLGLHEDDLWPRFAEAAEVTPDQVRDDEPVYGVAFGDEAAAYPVRFFYLHDVINDTLGDTPIVVFYNAIARATAAFERVEHDGKQLAFGSSGLLFQGASLAYDNASISLWNGMTGEAISGELLGTQLPRVRLVSTRFGAWKEEHPNTRVMVGTEPETGIRYDRDYAVGVEDYHETAMILYPFDGFEDDYGIHPKAPVLGVLVGEAARAYPAFYLLEEGRIEDEIGGVPVTIEFDAETGHVEAVDADGEPLHTMKAYWFAWKSAFPHSDIEPKPAEEPEVWPEAEPDPPEPPPEEAPFVPQAPGEPGAMPEEGF